MGEMGQTRPATLVTRREMLQRTGLGLAAISLGVGPASRALGVEESTTLANGEPLQLTIRDALVEMVDRTQVYSWVFDSPQAGLRFPGPVIEAQAGAQVAIEVTNQLTGTHSFAVHRTAIDSGPIGPGETKLVTFTAPPAGLYVYLDPMEAPRNRLMGLAGILVVWPAPGALTPYSTPTPSVSNLFEDLGTTYIFPGQPWVRERTWVWAFNSIDPYANAAVAADPTLSGAAYKAMFHPRYFTLNGKSGFFSSNDYSIAPHGRVGQPAIIRVANLGAAFHSPHCHGNHIYVLARNGTVEHNVIGHDTWELPPLDTTDVLLPFEVPPDAYPWPPSDPSVFETDLAGDGTHGMAYPVHCHTELSLLANGANYPQGIVTHWVLTGDLVDGGTPPGPGPGPGPYPGGGGGGGGSSDDDEPKRKPKDDDEKDDKKDGSTWMGRRRVE